MKKKIYYLRLEITKQQNDMLEEICKLMNIPSKKPVATNILIKALKRELRKLRRGDNL